MKTLEEKAVDYMVNLTCEDAADPVEMVQQAYLAGAKEALCSQWRSVEDELPKPEQDVLVATRNQTNHQFAFAWLSTLSNGTLRWYSYDDTFPLNHILFWMPIPELKEGGEND